jgi:alpha-amylase
MTGTVRALFAALLLLVAQGSYARAQEQSAEVSRVEARALPSVAERHASLPPSRSPTSIRDVDLRPQTSGVRYTASPEDWRDAEVYLVMPDRFERGRGAIPSGDPANGRSWHGGNIRGLIDRLPYIRPIANTLWITPVLRNSPDSYHGYGAVNLLDVDPRYGTLEDYKELVDAAHGMGMRVIMDFVFNHAGNVFSYRNGEQRFGPGQKEIGPINRNLVPSELRSAEHFSRRGVAAGDQWNDEDAIVNADFGDPDNAFEPLRDFATDNRATQNILIRTAMHWMRTTNIDGMRLDTVKHTAPSLWPRVAQTLSAYARTLRSPDAPEGKRNFLLLGEIFSGDRNVLGRQLGPYGRGLSSVFDFASAFGNRAALQGKAATSALERNFHESKAAFGERAPYLTQFHENHDVPRFLREGDPREQLDVATAHTLFSSGIPQLFYGNEQAMPQMDDGNPNTGDPGNRPDMFAGQYKPRALIGRSSFDPNSAAYRRQQSMIAVRRAFDPLRRGDQ